MSGKLKNDLTGKKYGKLTVLHRSADYGNGKKKVIKWDCQCECGKHVAVKSDSLLSGHTVSCGCNKIKHHASNKERLYNIWKCMRQRCLNPRNVNYRNYGKRGITICDEWSDYLNFKNWAISHGYDHSLSIDRIDVNGNYEPKNCRWATNKEQANNTTRNRYVEYHGEVVTMAELADSLNVSYSTIQHRIERGQMIAGGK